MDVYLTHHDVTVQLVAYNTTGACKITDMGNLTNPVSIAEQGTGDMYDKWDFTYTY
jgi:hypothetical protein